MSNQSVTKEGTVPFSQKLAFGLGMLANQMFPAVLGIFMVVLVQNLGFPGWMWGIIYFFPRIFDSFTDPIMGFISDNTKSKWGRRRQYVFIGSIVMGLAFVIMWQLHSENSVNYNFFYFMFWSFIFYLGLTIFSVPYVAMGYEMSDDFHERTNIMAVAQWIGQWAWIIAPWFWVIMYNNGPDGWFDTAEGATRTLAVWVGVVLMFLAMVPAIFIKSKPSLNENYSELNLNNIKGSFNEIILGFKEALKIAPFRKLCISTFFIFNAFNTVATFTFFIIVYQLFNGDAVAANAGYWPTLFGCLGALSTTFMVIPTVAWMSRKLGKKKAFIVSQSISIIGYIMFWFLLIPGKPYMFIFALPFFSFGIGSLFTLMMSMTSDVIDLDELNTGKRREGIFGAIYWWMVKFGFAIAGGLSGIILWIVGFQEGIPSTEQEGAIVGLRIFFSGLPILGTLIAIYVMRDYELDEAKANEIRVELDKKKKLLISSNYGENKLASLLRRNGISVASTTDVDFTTLSEKDIAEQFKSILQNKIHGLCFSPYEESQDIGDALSKAQIARRMEIVAPYTKWIRSFSTLEGNELIPGVAKSNGLKSIVGAWIGYDKEANEREISALIKLGQNINLDIVAVGNEAILRGDLTEEDVIAYINRVRKALPNVQVGYADAYFQFVERPKLVQACDVILANCYPFWEGCSVENAATYLQQMYAVLQGVAQGKRIIISETGWPSDGSSIKSAVPSKLNAMKYFINIHEWQKTNNIELFYFSSFDESWKIHQEGDVGARWGIWDKNEILKYS
jgi:GPH family glycoside/pentoside/hexuronide:cation symporter